MTSLLMPKIPPIYLKWGPQYQNTMNLNDGQSYWGKAVDTRSGAEMDILFQEQSYTHPRVERVKPRERVFGLKIALANVEPNTAAAQVLETNLKRALYSGLLRLTLKRGNDLHTLECYCSQIKEGEPGQFEAQMSAPNPFFALENGAVSFSRPLSLVGLDGLLPDVGQYLPIPLDYTGSAPAEPVITFQIGARGGIYQYYRDIVITNNSPNAWHNRPICFDLGDIRSGVGTKFHELGANTLGMDTHMIRDIRIESPGGARKQFFVRDSGMRGGTWHQSVKLWTVIYSLAPGASKILRVLYGNPNAPGAEIYPEQSQLKCMFHMYNSDNAQWQYQDFAPAWDQPQTRLNQWTPYIPQRWNIAWIAFRHDGFDNLTGEANINCAGARATMYAPASGATGMQLFLDTGVASVDYTYRISTNGKVPLVPRWQHRNLQWEDQTDPFYIHADGTSTMRALTVGVTFAGASILNVDRTVARPGIEYFHTAQEVIVRFSDGTAQRFGLTAVNDTLLQLTLSTPIPVGKAVAAGAPVQAVVSDSRTLTFNTTTPDYPLVLAFVLRVDQPTLTIGDWYFGGVEAVTIHFATAEQPSVTAWASATEVDIVNQHYHLRGRFGNPGVGALDPSTGLPVGEYLRINYITNTIFDRVIVDCAARQVWYQPWSSVKGGYGPLVNIQEALQRETVRYYWVHLEPGAANQLVFIHDSDSNFRDSDVYLDYPTLFY